MSQSNAGAAPEKAMPSMISDPNGEAKLSPITLELFRGAAKEFANELQRNPMRELYGVTDGKAVGTKVEAMFKEYLQKRYEIFVGNAANGLDFPTLNLDLKVTSSKQPQSSCPFRAATQKIYGLGYNLLVIVYSKRDVESEHVSYLDIKNVVYIDKERTADYTLTTEILNIISKMEEEETCNRDVVRDELDALLENKNIPLDEVSRSALANRLIDNPPKQGVLTISNALQWRLQYSRAINITKNKDSVLGVEDLYA